MKRLPIVMFSAALALAACRKADEKAAGVAPAPAPAAAPAAAAPAAPTAAAPAPAPLGDSKLLAVGTPAPDVTGKSFDGQEISLAKLVGKPVVVYFYPKDGSPGCTTEAHDFRDDSAAFAALGAVVVGVSTDTIESHKSFTETEKLNFPLLSDADGKIAAKFGVDTTRGYARRTTFVIGKDGKIAKVFPDVHVQGHSDEVLAAVKEAAGT
jgi:peroxiredoxin Q/BCP